MVTIVRRQEIPEIHDVLVDGERYVLGVLKDFRWHASLAGFMPPGAKISFSWVHLEPGQVLDPHVHPVASMILVCEGEVRSLGEIEQHMGPGDALLVPAGHRHGFCGAGARGFWGLSIQFEASALYEDPEHPKVAFSGASPDWLDELLRANRTHLQQFADNPLFVLARQGALSADDAALAAFLDHFQVWSNAFQRMLLARATFSDDARFRAVATRHLEDEFGHNTLLARERGAAATEVDDPVLEATCEWFVTKMLSLDNAERTVLVHLVVEASAEIFYANVGPLTKQARAHFGLHSGTVDHDHVELGLDVLRRAPVRDAAALFEVQRRGWAMLNSMFARIAELLTECRKRGPRARRATNQSSGAPTHGAAPQASSE